MRYVYWARARTGRLFIILLTVIIYFSLLTVDALRYFPHFVSVSSPHWLPWVRYGFSAFVALMFLAVGALVWLYARSRRVALLLFCFSFTMTVAFAVQTEAALNDVLFSTIGTVSGSLALLLFSTLLLLFPKNYLSLRLQSSTDLKDRNDRLPPGQHSYYVLLLRIYLVFFIFLGSVVVLHNAIYYFLNPPISDWLNIINSVYYLLALTGILITIIFSYRRSSSLRERQQQRIFVGGVILTVAP